MSNKKLKEREKRREQFIEVFKSQHKCSYCVWGSWQGPKHFCMLPKCIKEEKP